MEDHQLREEANRIVAQKGIQEFKKSLDRASIMLSHGDCLAASYELTGISEATHQYALNLVRMHKENIERN